jgi:hypothetical protein
VINFACFQTLISSSGSVNTCVSHMHHFYYDILDTRLSRVHFTILIKKGANHVNTIYLLSLYVDFVYLILYQHIWARSHLLFISLSQ